jgi:uncharacterized protein YndB with AHSA1/START domain
MSTEAVKEIVVKAPPAKVFLYLTDPDLMVQWLGSEVSMSPVIGGELRVRCSGHPGVGEFTEIVPNEKVVFSFGWDEPDHPIPPGSTEVEISLTPKGEDTLVRLTHRGLPEDAVEDHNNGWGFYLDRLEKVMSGIDPGPETSTHD